MTTDTVSFDRLLTGLLAPLQGGSMSLTLVDATAPGQPLVAVNDAFCALTGYAAADAIGRNCRFLQGPRTDPAALAALKQQIAAGLPARSVLVNYRRDGSAFLNELIVTPIRDAAGVLRFFTGVQRAVGRRPALARPVRLALRPGGLDALDATTARWLEALDPHDVARLGHAARRASAGTAPLDLLLGVDATARRLHARGFAAAGGAHFVGELAEAPRDAALQARLRLLEAAAQHAADAIVITAAEPLERPGPRIVYASDAIAAHCGWRPEELLGQTPRVLQGPATDRAELARLGAALRRVEPISLTLRNHRRDGSEFWNDIGILPVPDEAGWITHWLSIQRDATHRQAEAERFAALSLDPLTGVANAGGFGAALDLALAAARARGGGCGVVRLDLDRFRVVNETHGDAAGDVVLVEAGRRLRAATRAEDTVARAGGDAFLVLFPGVDTPGTLREATGRLQSALAAPYPAAGRRLTVGASLGAALYPTDADTAADLLAAADLALHQAKRGGRGRVELFCSNQRESRAARGSLAEALRTGLARGEIEPFFQPQIALATGAVTGFETLLRWRHPTLGVLAPEEFLDVAAEHGLVGKLGEVVLDSAIAVAADWLGQGLDPGRISVNLDAGQCADPSLVEGLETRLRARRLPPQRLVVELVESVLADGSVAATVGGLHRLGVGIDLDDFGAGHASLTHLRSFPIERIKIDRSFVADIGTDPDDRALVGTMVRLAHSLGLRAVADGVTTAEQRAFLMRQGCDEAQGEAFARPMPAHAAAAWLTQRAASAPVARA